MQARMTRDFAAVEHIGATILQSGKDNAFVRRALARQFDELQQHDEARRHWLALRDQFPADFEAAFHVARDFLREGATLQSALAAAAPNGSAAFLRNLGEVLEEPDEDAPPDSGIRHIAICGVSYCGSTLIDRLLGGLPNVASIGESHWLTKGRSGSGYGPLDFSSDSPPGFVRCSVCGQNCEVLTAGFRRHLAADRTNWYFRIARRLGTGILVSADKNPPKLCDQDPLLRLDGLVVFKSLAQAWMSELTKRPSGKDEEYYRTECERYIAAWIQTYATFIEHFSPQGKVAVLSFEEFTRDPKEVLRAACRSLSLEFDEQILKATRPGHAIGGNGRALGRLREAGYAPDISELEPCDLPQSHLRLIEESAEAKRIFDLLEAAHRHMMQQ